MAVARDRIIAWFFAVIFIISSSALTIVVIISLLQDDNKRNNGAASTPADNNTLQEESMNSDQLQGKPLANFTPVENIGELQKIEITPGTGEEVKAEDTITVDYTGALASTGVVFESSLDSGQPATFPLSGVIPGWTQGVPGTKVGGTIRLLIPAELAYGSQASEKIPANSDLVFDITVREIVKQ